MNKRPILISCQSASPVSRLAAEVAHELGSDRSAEACTDVEADKIGAEAGRAVMTLDGCPTACMSRLVAAKGVAPAAALRLDEFGVTPETVGEVDRPALVKEVSERLYAGTTARPPTRPKRFGRATHLPGRHVHNVEDYLLALDALASPVVECGALISDAPTLAAHVSEALGISRASASETLARLEAKGLISRGTRKELVLTPSGRLQADRIVRRHRIVECFASNYLGYPLAETYRWAREIEAAFNDEAITRLDDSLGHPERCPHGWPIDPARARLESADLQTVTSLSTGEQATVVRVAEHDEELLQGLAELEIVPGVTLTSRGTNRTGALCVKTVERSMLLTSHEAAGIFVASR